MLKLSSNSEIKCGEIFCSSLNNLTIICTFCEMKSFQLDDFLKHLENVHFEDSKEMHDEMHELEDNVLEYYVEELVEGIECEAESSCKNENEHKEELIVEYEDEPVETSFKEGEKELQDNVLKEIYQLQGNIWEFDENPEQPEDQEQAAENSFEDELQENVLEDDIEEFESIIDIEAGSEEEKELQDSVLSRRKEKESIEVKSGNKIYEFEDEVETSGTQSDRSSNGEINESYDEDELVTKYTDYEQESSSNIENNLEEKSEKGSESGILLKKIHKEQEYNCAECQQKFALKKSLDKHVLEVHHGYKCTQCDKRFRLSHHHRRHELTHKRAAFNDHRKYPCKMTECSKIFTDPEVLKRHLEVHNLMSNEYVCEFENCGKSFDTKSRLTAHKHTHRKIKNFVCDACGFGCRAYGTLIIHQRIHTGEKPYACEICDRRFISTTAVNRHMLTHSDVRQYVCEICQAAFSTYGVLQRHRFIHSDKRTFQCKFCDKAFKQVHGLDGHIRRIHMEPKEKKS